MTSAIEKPITSKTLAMAAMSRACPTGSLPLRYRVAEARVRRAEEAAAAAFDDCAAPDDSGYITPAQRRAILRHAAVSR